MSRWRNNGGWNKTYGTVEEVHRIDSFEAGTMDCGALFAYRDGKPLILDCDHYTDYGPETDREIVELWAGEWIQALELIRIPSGFGGSRPFWLCPACGGRVRYLYQAGGVFLCRKCSRLNYRSQQETKSDSMYYYRKGVALAEKRLDTWPGLRPDWFSFCEWVPGRPRYMHESTYRRYLRRFAKYQDQHQRRQLEDMVRLLKIFNRQ